jgi:hypothetical protein
MTKIGTRNDMVENARHDMKRTVPEDRIRTLDMTSSYCSPRHEMAAVCHSDFGSATRCVLQEAG